MKISVIVPVYQDWNDALALLSCLADQTLSRDLWDVILVDNGSDHIPELPDTPFSNQLLNCLVPGSYAARNAALEVATGDLLVFTDADCRPVECWLEELLAAFETSSGASLVAGDVFVDKLDEGKPNIYELYDMALGLPQRRYVTRGYAVTANLAIRRSVFDDIGLFDATRFSGGDAEFCQRAVARGHQLGFCETAVVLHPARDNWQVLARKIRRVKGGQIRNGPLSRRFKFLVRTFLPPVFAFLFTLQSPRLNSRERLSVCLVQIRLWMVEMHETVGLMLGRKAERR